MRIFYGRPLALAACLFALCSVFIYHADSQNHLFFLTAVSVAFVAVLLFFMIRRKVGKHGWSVLLCLAALLLSSAISYGFFRVQYAALRTYIGTECEVEATVVKRVSSQAFYTQLQLDVDNFNGQSTSFGAILECEYPSSLQVGERIRLKAVPRDFTEEDSFQEASYRLSDDCLLVFTSNSFEDYSLLPSKSSSLRVKAAELNSMLSQRLYQAVGREGGGLVTALVLGNQSYLSPDENLAFQRSGVSHHLALSGMHVSILVLFLELFLQKLRIPKFLRAFLIPGASIAYYVLTGMTVSMGRAVVMVCLVYLAFLWRSDYDPITALCVALALILAVSPYAVLDQSLWLSFVAAGAILVFSPSFTAFFEKRRENTHLPLWLFKICSSVLSAVFVSAVANLCLMPLSAGIFWEISLWSIPATLILSIPVTVMLVGGLLVLMFPFLPLLPQFCGLLGSWSIQFASLLSEQRGSLLSVYAPACSLFLILLTLVLILWAILPIRKQVCMATLSLLCAVAVVFSSVLSTQSYHNGEVTSVTIAAGHGVVRLYTRCGEAVLVNDTYGLASSAYNIKYEANLNYCTEIEHLIFCKNYNQATYFIAALSKRIRVHNVHLPPPETEEELAMVARIQAEAELHGISVYYDAYEQLAFYEPQAVS